MWARRGIVEAACTAVALGSTNPTFAADLVVNGSFVAEDFEAAPGWLASDDKYGTASQASDLAVWSDEAPSYGAILRVCQDASDVGGSSGGVWGTHIEQTVALQAGVTYNLSFWAAELGPNEFDPPCALHSTAGAALQVQVYGQASGELLSQAVSVAACGASCGSTHELELVAPANETAVLKFYFGGQWAKLKLAGVTLLESSGTGGEPGANGVSVNQLGYLSAGPKRATVRTASTQPLPWELRDAQGTLLASGMTQPFGSDALSGDSSQHIDFGSFTGSGVGLRLFVDGASSVAFDVADDVYAGLRRDSLRFFYHQRCGQSLGAAEAEDESFARAPDHGGDAAATCSAGQSCGAGYPLDVSKGWHDAGDYGKYVITGGVTVWTLLNLYERASLWGTTLAPFADGALNTAPENGVSDLLDEARHELELMLGMQVPEGNPLAGMAHHKLHSDDWVAMPTHPDADASPRFLRPPSTAATLGLAATGAQCARIWRDIDAVLAARCREAAERAWTAARAHPDLFAPASSNVGGGPYDDDYVGDEFYWAAAELFATTGGAEYADALRASSHFAGFSAGSGPLSWPGTAGFGTISLSLQASALLPAERAQMRQAIVDEAERYLAVEAQNGYGVPLETVIWGSNGDALNAGIVLALAHDLTGEDRFFKGAASALDYVLGRNPLDRSYVTRYGSAPVSQLHHTRFAPYLNASFPAPPAGFLVGGPNADLTAFADPGVAIDCSPLRCWSEVAGAYWFIEVAINWNAPLAWLSSWLDEQGRSPRSAPVGVAGPTGGNGGSGGSGAGANGGAAGNVSGGATGVAGSSVLDPSAALGSGDAGNDSGCACRVTQERSNASRWAVAAFAALAWARRRRR